MDGGSQSGSAASVGLDRRLIAEWQRGLDTFIAEGLECCGQLGAVAVVVLGHAEYHPRFGFSPASRFGLRCEYDVPDDVFMVRELSEGALKGMTGTIRYHPVFSRFERDPRSPD